MHLVRPSHRGAVLDDDVVHGNSIHVLIIVVYVIRTHFGIVFILAWLEFSRPDHTRKIRLERFAWFLVLSAFPGQNGLQVNSRYIYRCCLVVIKLEAVHCL